jgi:hypothetical protein
MEQNYTKANDPNHTDTLDDYRYIIGVMNDAAIATIRENYGVIIVLNENIVVQHL